MWIKQYKIYLLSLLSGTALIFCFPRFDLYPLAWFCLAPFLISLLSMKAKEAFCAGMFMGVPYFFGTQYWIYHSINHYGGVPLSLSLGIVLLLSLYMSLYTGIFALMFSFKIKATRLPAMFLAPVFWVALEFLRSYALTGFPWSSIGYSQYKFLGIIQFADITGIYGVSALVMAVNGALADIFILRRRKTEMPLFSATATLLSYVFILFIIVGAFSYGHYRLTEARQGKPMKVSVIQGNIPQDIKWSPAYQREVFDIYKGLTASLKESVDDGAVSMIVWPETAAPFYFGADKALTEELLEFAQTLDSHLLFGAVTVKGDAPISGLSNSAILLNKAGEVIYVYDKIHMVPFGEYVPLRRVLFFIDKLTTGIGDYVPGEKHIRAETPFGSFGTLICYEIIFPGLVRKFYQQAGDFIVTITNDAWFGSTNGPYQHFSMAVMRAVENRKPVIRAANTGISGFIDSSGRILKQTRLFERKSLTMDLQGDATRSFYSRYGDLFSYLVIVMTLLLLMNLKKE